MTPFTKSVATRQYFTKSQNHFFTKPKYYFGNYFYKAQILIWHLFSKAQDAILAKTIILSYKTQILIWHYFYKAQILIWQLSLHYFIKPKYYFGNSFIKPKYYFGNYLYTIS